MSRGELCEQEEEVEEERAEEGRAKVFEGAEYTSSFCHAKDQAGEGAGTGGRKKGYMGVLRPILSAHTY